MRNISNEREELGTGSLDDQHGHEFSLPQADGGKDAWLFLAACFIVEALVWGKLFIAAPRSTSLTDDVSRFPVLIWCIPRIL